MTALLLCAWARSPVRVVRLFLEMNAVPIRLRQVLRIDNFNRHDKQWIAGRHLKKVEVLRERGVRAVRHTVAHQVSWPRFRRYHFQRGTRRSASSNRKASQCRRRTIPRGNRYALPVIALGAWL